MKIIEKYWKIILPVAIVGLLFSIYFLGQCNGKRLTKSEPTKDTITSFIKKVQEKDSLLLCDNTNLMNIAKQEADSIKILKNQLYKNGVQTIILISKVKKLSLDSSIKYMAGTFNDKTSIVKQVDGNDTGVVITPKQVKEHNVASIERSSCLTDNTLLQESLILYVNMVATKDDIIRNDSTIINDKIKVITAYQKENYSLTDNLNKVTKQFHRQRFWKDVFEATTLVAIIFAAIK